MNNQIGLTQLLAIGLILALSVFVLASVILYQNNSDLQKQLYANTQEHTAQSTELTPTTPETTFNGEPIDWEGGNQIDYFTCSLDSDCIKVQNNDCGCSESGYNLSINKKYAERWEVRRKNVFSVCDAGGTISIAGETDEEKEARKPFTCREAITNKCINSKCVLLIL
ncbi:MAG: hypothetical protein V1838_00505 [Patescibacteria group bacterium]